MSKINFPAPKTRTDKGSTATLVPQICGDAIFSDAISVFTEYAKIDFDVTFSTGDAGIRIVRDATLAEESCRMELTESGIDIWAATAKGANHALAILLSLITTDNGKMQIPVSSITDEPDCPYRGLMVDLARQYHPFKYLLKYVDLCYRNRASHLQLHFTEFQSFTLTLDCYPELRTEGRAYTKEEIKFLNEYAAKRGIELVPEIDIPGHSSQFMIKYPEIFGDNDVLPACDEVFDALKKIFAEVHEMFPNSQMIHIGGDEANIASWEKCERTQQYMKKHGIKDVHEMYAEYVRIVTDALIDMGVTPVVWEGFSKEYNDRISKKVIVIAWESYYQLATDLAEAGFTLINCSWKPLYVVTPAPHWSQEDIMGWNPWNWQHWWDQSVASKNPINLPKDATKVLGGQICAWGDNIADREDYENAVEEELALIGELLPALCQRLIDLNR